MEAVKGENTVYKTVRKQKVLHDLGLQEGAALPVRTGFEPGSNPVRTSLGAPRWLQGVGSILMVCSSSCFLQRFSCRLFFDGVLLLAVLRSLLYCGLFFDGVLSLAFVCAALLWGTCILNNFPAFNCCCVCVLFLLLAVNPMKLNSN